MSTLKITTIQCITPSTGVAGWWETTVSGLSSAVGAVLGVAAVDSLVLALEVETAGFATLLLALDTASANVGAALGGSLATLGNSASKSLGQDIADQLYVKVQDKKVWPSDADTRIKAGQTVTVNYQTTFSGSVDVKLMEWDHISDDNLGETVFNQNSTSGVYVFGNPKEQDMYAVTIEITP